MEDELIIIIFFYVNINNNMDTRIIEVRKNVNIFQRINLVSSFSSTISNVNFTPDEVIIKGIAYLPDANEPVITVLYSEFLSEIIGPFFDNFYIKPDLHFILRKPVNTLWTFQIRDYTGLLNPGRVGDLSIDLEFVKYRTDLPDVKIY